MIIIFAQPLAKFIIVKSTSIFTDFTDYDVIRHNQRNFGLKRIGMKDITCLLVDDDEDDHEIFEIALKDTGTSYQYITAGNGVDALQKLRNDEIFTPDFIFLDLNMPVMNGKQCLREIKEITRLRTTPVIIYSTSSYTKDIEEMQHLGAAHFFIKPSNMDVLSKTLLALFQNESLPFSLPAEN